VEFWPYKSIMKIILITAASIFLCASCVFNEAAAISFFDSSGVRQTLNARSKKAQSGEFSFDTDQKFIYELAVPLSLPPDYSLAIEYTLSDVPPDAKPEIVVSFYAENGNSNSASFILPANFLFLGINNNPSRVQYSMPLNIKTVQKIIVSSKAGGKKTGGTGRITGIQIIRRTFGWNITDSTILISPFVYAGIYDSKGALYIKPPPEYASGGKINLQLQGISATTSFVTGDKRWRYICDNPNIDNSIMINEGVFDTNPYPIIVEGSAESVFVIPAAEKQFPLEPIPADPGVILSVPQSSWRDSRYEVYQWDIFPSILIFDTADYAVQDRLLKRLAFFAEKRGYRGRIVSDAEIEDQHGWNAHDYRAQTLADFYNAANKIKFPLNNEERELEKILIANNIVQYNAARTAYIAGEGAVISISRENEPAYLRRRFMAHESFHGIFFVDKDFRAFSEQRLANLNSAAKRFLKSYFEWYGYDVSDNYLYVNEFMAYVLQEPVSAAADYFGKYCPEKLESHEWRYRHLPEKDEATGTWPILAEAFEAEARAFSNYATTRWGLAAGKVWRIKPR
jgi:hypothetical protein